MLLAACGKPTAQVPAQYSQLEEQVNIFPDYTDVVIPPNIAPLNFIVRDSLADAFVVQLQGKNADLLAAADKDGVIQMDLAGWKNLLAVNKGTDITVTVFANRRRQMVFLQALYDYRGRGACRCLSKLPTHRAWIRVVPSVGNLPTQPY